MTFILLCPPSDQAVDSERAPEVAHPSYLGGFSVYSRLMGIVSRVPSSQFLKVRTKVFQVEVIAKCDSFISAHQ